MTVDDHDGKAEAADFLQAVSGFTLDTPGTPKSINRPVRLAQVIETYTSGLVHVLFDGEDSVGTKGYASLSTYYPQPGDRVALIPVGQSFLIIGKIDGSPRRFVTWQNLVPYLKSPWKDYTDAAQSEPRFARSSDGWVKVKGLVAGGSTSNLTVVGTLPPGYRPTGNLLFATTAIDQFATIDVTVDGDIRVRTVPSNTWLSLDPISFIAEQ